MTAEKLIKEIDHLAKIQKQLMVAKKLKLTTGLAGYENDKYYGIFNSKGGNILATVTDNYFPTDLNLLFTNIVETIHSFGSKFDLNTLEYNEYAGGKKVNISIETSSFEVKSPLVGDVYKNRIIFNTGFDSLTKTSLSFKTLRLVCKNGNKSWQHEIDLAYKNTVGNQGKIGLMTKEILQVNTQLSDYHKDLEKLVNTKLTHKDVQEFYFNLLGYSYDDYKDLHQKSRFLLDKINESVAIEEKDLKMSKYTLLQGITRYVSHNLTEESLLYGSGQKLSKKAHQILLN